MGSIEVTASEELGGGKKFSGVFLAGGGWGVYFCARFFYYSRSVYTSAW